MAEPVLAQKGPYRIELKAEYRYAWCSCGRSGIQPFCDGSHTQTGGEYKPVVFIADKDRTVLLCGCKRTGKQPYCDSTHKKL
jgi:CDGSH-type Zn-finger protein